MPHQTLIAFARRIATQASPVRVARGLLVACVALFCGAAFAQASPADASFDHAKTGFSLGAQHATARCESCHTQGVFRGTPRECAQCHRNASRPTATQFPVRHIPTTQACDNCHRASVWNVVVFRHQGVTKGTCNSCHNTLFASGKPRSHQPVIGSCDLCHNTITWTATRYDHTGVAKGSCASCHNNNFAKGKGVRHPPDGNRPCDTCHSTNLWTPATYPHEPDVRGRCSTCHDNVTALGKAAAHIPDNRQCDTCHGSTASFRIRTMDHTGLSGQCSTCHGGAYISQNAVAKNATHVPTTAQCDTCHTTVAWRPAGFTHDATTAGTCNTCHNGITATGKNAGHIPSTAQCDTCHASTNTFLGATMNHTGLAGQCSTCHSGAYLAQNAQTKSAAHVVTAAQCDSCHSSTTTWATATFDHFASGVVIGSHSCSTNCHIAGRQGLPKPSTHIPTSGACDNCHTNFIAFKPANMDHTGMTGTCTTCHSGGYAPVGAQAKPTSHIPTGQQCDTCHTNFVAFRPAAMNHTGSAGACSTCHSGAYVAVGALAKPATHVATSAQCDTCHRITSAWTPAFYTHDSTATRRCSVCHNNVNAIGKGATHIPDNRQCDTCHTNFTAFRPALMSHAGLSGQCATCHNGAYLSENAQAKSPTHVPTNAQCDSSGCHASTATWATTTVDHALLAPPVVMGDHSCANCHKTGGTGLPKPTNHIPTAAACDTCHMNFGAFRPAFMSHTGTNGSCSTCHSGGYVSAGAQGAQAKPPTHIPTGGQCDVCHSSTNFAAFKPATMNHTGTNGQCSTCHNGAYVGVGSQGALAKPTTHIPTSAQCDSCHTTTAWIPATGKHDANSPGRCLTCHNGISAMGKNAGHIPTASQCDACHNNYVAFRPAAMSHAGLTNQCSTCHSGGYLAQNAQAKSANHLVTSLQCDSSGCHNSTVTWAGATFNHTGVTIGGHTCANAGCHVAGGSGLPKPSTHIPTSGACDNCHRNFAAFAPATMDHTGLTGSCISCHNSVNATGKPSGRHIPTSAGCEVCHRTTAWLPLLTPYSHTGVAAGSCSNCHSSGYLNIDVKPVGTHIPTNSACDQCHRTAAWLPLTSYLHTGVAPGTCLTCHTAQYTSMTLKPANHIPTDVSATWSSCDACHKSTSTFANARIHSTVFTSVSSYPNTCLRCHYRGNTLGVKGPPNDSRHTKSPGNGSCDQSGCHRKVTDF
ncbi:MAG: hypothetical protein HZA64_02765 [Rhodocyclales bacterium]|nr:hypothetical protein [Rhodocyclales bacterium]